jgi:hypothetical protein
MLSIGIYPLYIRITTLFDHKWARNELGHINFKCWNYNFLKTLNGLQNELGHINYILEIQEMLEKAKWTNKGDVSKLFDTHLGYMLMSKRWIHFLSRNSKPSSNIGA